TDRSLAAFIFISIYHLNNFFNQPSIKRPPSAELKPNQKDTDSLPPYEELDPILKLYVEEDYSLDKIVEKGFDRRLVKKVIKMVDANEYKRRQAPVGIKITPRAFGKDRRMPITNRFFF
ncbi:MAG: NAD+ synthase, partial [Candidatus Omnitrophota bacterium]